MQSLNEEKGKSYKTRAVYFTELYLQVAEDFCDWGQCQCIRYIKLINNNK